MGVSVGEIVWSSKGHSHAVLVNFKNKKYVLTSMNAHKIMV